MKLSPLWHSVAAALAVLAVVPAHAGVSLNACSDGSSKGPTGLCTAPTATVINAPGGKRRTESFFMGINWNFGTKAPELVLGVRGVRTGADKKSEGLQLDVFLPFLGGISFDRVRVSYVAGQRSALGQFALGYSFSQQTPLIGLGVQAAHVNFGLDYLFRGTALPYVGLNSLTRPKAPTSGVASTTYNCTNGSLVSGVDNFFFYNTQLNGPVQTLDGRTCYANNQQAQVIEQTSITD